MNGVRQSDMPKLLPKISQMEVSVNTNRLCSQRPSGNSKIPDDLKSCPAESPEISTFPDSLSQIPSPAKAARNDFRVRMMELARHSTVELSMRYTHVADSKKKGNTSLRNAGSAGARSLTIAGISWSLAVLPCRVSQGLSARTLSRKRKP